MRSVVGSNDESSLEGRRRDDEGWMGERKGSELWEWMGWMIWDGMGWDAEENAELSYWKARTISKEF